MWKAFGIGSVASVTLAQAALLLVVAAAAAPFARLLLVGTLVAAAVVAVQVSVLVLSADTGDASWRFLGVVAILDVLGTVVVAALSRFGGSRSETTVRSLELPPDLGRMVESVAMRTGRRSEEVLRSAVLLGLEGHAADTPTGVRRT